MVVVFDMSHVEGGIEDSLTKMYIIVIHVKVVRENSNFCKKQNWDQRYRKWLLTGCTRGQRKIRGISQS